jgi:hypothetical protein
MKLIPLSDYVLELWNDKLMSEIGIRAINYAQFLKQKIKLEMFVPCGKSGNVLEYPINISISDNFRFERATLNYLEAKENVLFEGFFVKKNDDGILCLFHEDYEWEFAEIEPNFVWGRTNEFTIEDVVNYNPRLSLFVLNENAISRLLQACC